MFVLPLIISTCLIALSHGSNEINVAAPTASMVFLLDAKVQEITEDFALIGIGIGLFSLIFGFATLGKRHLHKYRFTFQRISLQK